MVGIESEFINVIAPIVAAWYQQVAAPALAAFPAGLREPLVIGLKAAFGFFGIPLA